MIHGWQSKPTDGPTGGWRCRVVCRVSCVLCRVSCVACRVSSVVCGAPCVVCRVSCLVSPVSCLVFSCSRVSCLVSRVLVSRVSCLVFSRLVCRMSYVSCRVRLKVVRMWCVCSSLTSTSASRRNGVHFFDV